MVYVYLVRHAQTDYNAHASLVGGRSNHIPLSAVGMQQAEQLGKMLDSQGIQFDKVCCSIAQRARQTLDIVLDNAPYLSFAPVDYRDELQELSQGDWEGQPRATIYTAERLAEINANQWLFKAPGGESQKEVEERMLALVMEQIEHSRASHNVLIVGHGVAFKCLLRGILDISTQMAYKLCIDNASLCKLSYSKEQGWWVHYINRVPYLQC